MLRAVAAVLFASFVIVPVLAQDAPKAAHDVLVEVPTSLVPGSKAAARVVVYETKGLNRIAPIEGASVEIALADSTLYSGKTGAKGSVEATFEVPALPDGDYALTVKTRSGAGEHTAPFQVKLARDVRILLVSDKPLYQPGQIMRLRALALDAMTMKALGDQELLLEIEDAKGNKVFKRAGRTSAFGVAATDFQLADEVLMGDYKITATLAGQKSEKTVAVRKYVLPKFKLEVKTEKPFYRPLEKVKGTIQADYFFGKPVNGEAVIRASTFDVAFREFATTTVKTDARGAAEFEIQLPDYFVGQPLDKGSALVSIEVTLTDGAAHAETVTRTASVCSQPLLLGVVPESGKIVPGLENIVYVLASSPDGSAVEADVELTTPRQKLTGRTNAGGFAALRLTPGHDEMADGAMSVSVSAKDKQGHEAKRTVALSSEYGRDQILVRPGASVLKVGESLALDVLGTFDERTVFVDVVRRGQTILTTTCDVAKGRGRVDLPLTPDLFGSLEVHAYAFMGDASIVRDSRVVFVRPADDLSIQVTPDRAQYLPGQEASIAFRVTDAGGKGVQSALGVIVVDESVYALQEMQPGLERIFFMLQRELLEPKIDIKWGPAVPTTLEPADTAELEARRREAATILLAPAALPARRATVNTMSARVGRMNEKLSQIYYALNGWIAGEKGRFWVEEGGKRTMAPDVLDTIVAKATNFKLQKEALIDAWGNRIAIRDLAAVDPVFTFEFWAKYMSAQNVQAIWTALHGAAAKHDLAAPDILGRLVEAKALTEANLKDYFGDAVTMEKLAAGDPAFTRENLTRLMEDARRQAIFQRLVELSSKEAIFTAERKYVAGLMEKVGAFVRPDGTPYDLDALARESASFSPANVARIADVMRRGAVYTALVSLAQRGGFDKVATSGAAGWTYKADAMRVLVAEKLLEEGQTRDVSGRAFDPAAIAASDAQFAAGRVVGGLLRGACDKIANAVCNAVHNRGAQRLPEDALKRVVDAKALTAAEVRDPWGSEYRFEKVSAERPGSFGCGLLSGQYTIVSAGPDRAFGSADDLNVGAMNAGGSYQPDYTGCVFHQGDPTIRTVRPAGDELEDSTMLADLDRGGWDARAARPTAAPEAPGLAAGRGGRLRELEKKVDRRKDGKSKDDDAPQDSAEGGMGPRVREHFPETLVWQPSIITDADGRATLSFTMADSITRWRLTASANSADGRLGSATAGLLVFQDFFVDIDLPVALTQNDVVSIPVAVYNYLKEKQTVTLTMSGSDGFELRDGAERQIELEPNQVRSTYFRVRASGLGPSNRLEVRAKGSKGAKDAIARSIEIVPDGKMSEIVLNGSLRGDIRHTVTIPADSVSGASKILFKAYPGIFASVIDGLDGMLRMPGG